MTRRVTSLLCLLTLSALAACSDDDTHNANNGQTDMGGADSGVDMIRCVPGEMFDPATGGCVPIFPDDDMPADLEPDSAGDMSIAPDQEPDLPPVDMGPDIDPACDKDNDGDLSIACGGTDCDDNNNRRNGRNFEICDDFDNDCDNEVNNGIDCTFFAHTGDNPPKLYSIDPFKKEAIERSTSPERFLDIDTHPDGTLYAVTANALWSRSAFGEWTKVGQGFGNLNLAQVNGLAIDRDGVVFATGGSNLYRISITTGRAENLGSLGMHIVSSGDCVVNKGNNLYMTAKQQGQPDRLIQITYTPGVGNAAGMTTTREIGSIGYANVFGLTAAWGRLFGTTLAGELIEINATTGAGTLIHKFDNRAWYGAASTPAR
jgi:hypothetical protein